MTSLTLLLLGSVARAGAGWLAGLIGGGRHPRERPVDAYRGSRSNAVQPLEIGAIDLPVSIVPAQALAASFGARLAPRLSATELSRIFAGALAVTGATMLRSSMH